MTTQEEPICWMVIAPLSAQELDGIAEHQYRKNFPFGSNGHSWEVLTSKDNRAALVSRLAGSEGSDWVLAEIISRQVGDEAVYSLWFDPERSTIVEWRNGKKVKEHADDPESFVAKLKFELLPTEIQQDAKSSDELSVAVVEGATSDDVRHSLFETMEEESWLNIEQSVGGIVVSTGEGSLGSTSWDLSEALPASTVYHIQRNFDPEEFSVLILKGGDLIGSFRIPFFESDFAVNNIKGANTPSDILTVLGVQPSLLGFGA